MYGQQQYGQYGGQQPQPSRFLQTQPTGYSGMMMQPQPTGFPGQAMRPQPTGFLQPQPTSFAPSQPQMGPPPVPSLPPQFQQTQQQGSFLSPMHSSPGLQPQPTGFPMQPQPTSFQMSQPLQQVPQMFTQTFLPAYVDPIPLQPPYFMALCVQTDVTASAHSGPVNLRSPCPRTSTQRPCSSTNPQCSKDSPCIRLTSSKTSKSTARHKSRSLGPSALMNARTTIPSSELGISKEAAS